MKALPASPKKKQEIVAQQVNGTKVLLNLENGQYYALDDDVGFRVWELCDGNHTVPDIVSKIATEYDAPSQTIEADVLELLENFINENLILDSN
jgi:hypothetical protein